jgi:quercetin dioxygenase-like cupin family protein
VLLQAGEGERLPTVTRVATIKVGREELPLIEFELEPGFKGPPPHSHDDHVDSFYVLEGEAEFLMESEKLVLGAGSFVAAPPGVEHTFTGGPRAQPTAERPRTELGLPRMASEEQLAAHARILRPSRVGCRSNGGETASRAILIG